MRFDERWPRIVSNVVRVGFYGFCTGVLLFLVFPVVVIIPLSLSATRYFVFPPRGFSLQWFQNFFGRSDWTDSAVLSVEVAVMTMGLALILGTLAAFGITRGTMRGKGLLSAFILSPMIVPNILVGIAIYFLFARLRIVGTTLGFVLAHTVLAIPFVVVVVSAALSKMDRRLEQAASSLGANAAQVFWRVTAPLIKPALLTALAFAFVTSFDELVIAIFISGPHARTLPKRMWDGMERELDPTVAAVSALVIIISAMAFAFAEIVRKSSR